jgi:hypothetical protein
MVNVNDKDFRYYSMPVHNPLYKQRRFVHREDIVRITCSVEKPEVIADIVPKPLVYNDDKILFDMNMIKELVQGFPEDFALWTEFGIKIPVTFYGEPKTYLCELYVDNSNVLFIDREFFGMPRVPGLISSNRNGTDIDAKLSDFQSHKDMLRIRFKSLRENSAHKVPPVKKVKKHPALIWLKYIPSASLNYNPDVKKLVEINYGKPPRVRKFMKGDGNIELLENAPHYLKEAGIAKNDHSMYFDMEFDIMGGRDLHNYL